MNTLLRLLFLVMLAVVVALVALVVAVPPARADGCGVVVAPSYGHYVAPQKVYHRDDYHAKKVTVLEYVPLYATGYYAPPQSDVDGLAKRLEQKLADLERKLSAGAPPGALPQKDDPLKAGLAVLQSRCASCHTGAAAKKGSDGKPVILFSQPGTLSPEADLVSVLLESESDHMPPGKPLTADEKKALRDLVRSARK